LSDPQPEVRVEAVRALGLIDDDGVLAALIASLKDPEARVRDMAGEALMRWRSPGVARRLADALSSPDLRRPAGDLLERMGQAAVAPLVHVVIRGDAPTSAVAASLIDRITGPHSFVAGLSAMDPEHRLRSVEVLGAIGGPTSSEALLTALSDPDQRVRIRSVALLGRLGDPRAIEPLKQTFLSDPVVEVAAAAEAALRELGSGPPQGPEGSSARLDLRGGTVPPQEP
jgi:HEAT repeat protein